MLGTFPHTYADSSMTAYDGVFSSPSYAVIDSLIRAKYDGVFSSPSYAVMDAVMDEQAYLCRIQRRMTA